MDKKTTKKCKFPLEFAWRNIEAIIAAYKKESQRVKDTENYVHYLLTLKAFINTMSKQVTGMGERINGALESELSKIEEEIMTKRKA